MSVINFRPKFRFSYYSWSPGSGLNTDFWLRIITLRFTKVP